LNKVCFVGSVSESALFDDDGVLSEIALMRKSKRFKEYCSDYLNIRGTPMTLDQLRYFLQAAHFEHVGKAAKSLNISPGAVSTAVSQLEDELKCQLFRRESRRIFLTQEGRELRVQADEILKRVHSLQQCFISGDFHLTGHYRFAGSHYLSARFLARAWRKLQVRFPHITGGLSSLPTAMVINSLLNGDLDFGFCFSPLVHPDLQQWVIYSGHLRVAVRRGHPLLSQGKKSWPLSKLSAYPAAIHQAAPGVDSCEHHPNFALFDVSPNVTTQFDSDDCAIEVLKSSNAWSLLPDLIIKQTKEIVAVPHPKEWQAPFHIALVARRRTLNQVLVAELLQTLKEMFVRLEEPTR
jgi:DNA-binding transcriptional LysR family regulator